jgi:hypothetical protein
MIARGAMARRTEVSPANAAKVVAIVCAEIDNARERITPEASWQRLEQFFHAELVHQRTLPTAVILAWAEAGHPAADRAIRIYAAEMIDRGRESELLVQVKGYVIKTLARPFVPYPRGRHVVQNLMRDIWLPLVVQNVAAGTGLQPTRSGSTATPSAAYFIALALKKRGFNVSERQLNRIYWDRNKIAARLEASMPAIPSTIK